MCLARIFPRSPDKNIFSFLFFLHSSGAAIFLAVARGYSRDIKNAYFELVWLVPIAIDIIFYKCVLGLSFDNSSLSVLDMIRKKARRSFRRALFR